MKLLPIWCWRVFFYVEMSLCRLHMSDVFVGELILTQMSVASFLTRCRQVSPWQEMGLEIEGEELVHTVRQNCFFFFFSHWLLPHCHGFNLILSCCSRSTDSQDQVCSIVAFKCVLFCLFLHEDLYLREECFCVICFYFWVSSQGYI